VQLYVRQRRGRYLLGEEEGGGDHAWKALRAKARAVATAG
jgi:hypothetical protein